MITRNALPFFTLCLLLPATLRAQDPQPMRTLLGGDHDVHHGGWGAPTVDHTRLLDQDALLVGGRGGWIIDHRFTLGLAGYGLATSVENPAYDDVLLARGRSITKPSRFVAGYGGLLLEPVIAYRSPVHVSLPVIIGAGGCGYQSFSASPHEFDPFTYNDDAAAFFVLEPGVELELNVIPLVRVAVGASYRYTSDLDLAGTSKDALQGFNAGIRIKVGSF